MANAHFHILNTANIRNKCINIISCSLSYYLLCSISSIKEELLVTNNIDPWIRLKGALTSRRVTKSTFHLSYDKVFMTYILCITLLI